MTVNPNNVLVGLAQLYVAPYGAGIPEPMIADTIAFGGTWGGNWVAVGGTDSGVSLGIANTMVDQHIEEQSTPVLTLIDTQEFTIDVTLDEDVVGNIQLAVGQGTLVTQAPSVTLIGKTTLAFSLGLNLYSIGFETINPFAGPTGLPMFRRMYIPKMVSGNAKVQADFTRAKTKRMYAASLRALCPSSAIQIIEQTAPHS